MCCSHTINLYPVQSSGLGGSRVLSRADDEIVARTEDTALLSTGGGLGLHGVSVECSLASFLAALSNSCLGEEL